VEVDDDADQARASLLGLEQERVCKERVAGQRLRGLATGAALEEAKRLGAAAAAALAAIAALDGAVPAAVAAARGVAAAASADATPGPAPDGGALACKDVGPGLGLGVGILRKGGRRPAPELHDLQGRRGIPQLHAKAPHGVELPDFLVEAPHRVEGEDAVHGRHPARPHAHLDAVQEAGKGLGLEGVVQEGRPAAAFPPGAAAAQAGLAAEEAPSPRDFGRSLA